VFAIGFLLGLTLTVLMLVCLALEAWDEPAGPPWRSQASSRDAEMRQLWRHRVAQTPEPALRGHHHLPVRGLQAGAAESLASEARQQGEAAVKTDVIVLDGERVVLFTPISAKAEAWFTESLPADCPRLGPATPWSGGIRCAC
jgi:hypothetical protein